MEPILWDWDFYIEYSADEVWKKTAANINHFHNSYEIYYLLENELLYHIDNQIYNVESGMLVVIPPNTIHTTRSLNSKVRKRMLINLPTAYIDFFLKDDPELLTRLHTPPFLIEKAYRNEITLIFNKLLNEYQQKQPNAILIKSLLGELLVTLGKLSKTQPERATLDSIDITTQHLLKIAEYINEHFMEPITLNTLSQVFSFNASYISRCFRNKLNISFSDYLKNVRIKETCKFLLNSSLSLSEIAERTGFNSTSDLCRVFKAVKCISPIQFKKLYRENSK